MVGAGVGGGECLVTRGGKDCVAGSVRRAGRVLLDS